MPFTQLTPEQRAKREHVLSVMREKFQREQRPVTKTAKRLRLKSRTGNIPPQGRRSDITLGQLAHACRIAAKMAADEPKRNPMFVEALSMAAEYLNEAAEAFPLPKH